MLENSLFESQRRPKTRKPATVVVSAIVHTAAVAVLLLIPLLQTQAIVIPTVDPSLLMPRLDEPASVRVFSKPLRSDRPQQSPAGAFTSPVTIPDVTSYEVPEPNPIDPSVPFSGNGIGFSSVLSNLGTGPTGIAAPQPPAPPPPPPPPPPPVVDARPIRQGGDVQAAMLIHQVKPVYPPIAMTARVQGVVVLEAVIAKDGSVDSLRVISGNQLLIPAALEAVKQWKYRPTLLNREPVAVITTITVTFTLQ